MPRQPPPNRIEPVETTVQELTSKNRDSKLGYDADVEYDRKLGATLGDSHLNPTDAQVFNEALNDKTGSVLPHDSHDPEFDSQATKGRK